MEDLIELALDWVLRFLSDRQARLFLIWEISFLVVFPHYYWSLWRLLAERFLFIICCALNSSGLTDQTLGRWLKWLLHNLSQLCLLFRVRTSLLSFGFGFVAITLSSYHKDFIVWSSLRQALFKKWVIYHSLENSAYWVNSTVWSITIDFV